MNTLLDEGIRLGDLAMSRRLTVATAESMTGGGVAESLVIVPGSGEWLAGGVIAYASRVKVDVLGVPDGPVVSERAALAMAGGVAALMHADVGIATTGCAGPEPMEDQPVGTLWVGVAFGGHAVARHALLDGDPYAVRAKAIRTALAVACDVVANGRYDRDA